MSRVDELVKMIQENDGNAEAIANSFIDDLNVAVAEYEKIKADNQKKKDAEALASHFNSFVKVHYPEMPANYEAQEMIEVFESFMDITKEIMKEFSPKEERKPKTLSEMIAEMGW